MNIIKRPLDMAREIVASSLTAGDTAVDATMGNGWDTVFLARLVGDTGKVWAFDIQRQALDRTSMLLEQEGLAHRVFLIHTGHEQLGQYVDVNLGAVMFNLGYLPGGDHTIVTRPATTIIALEASLKKIRLGGIITIVIYSGHNGGKEEEEALLAHCAKLPQSNFAVLHYRMLNQVNDPPSLLAIEKIQ